MSKSVPAAITHAYGPYLLACGALRLEQQVAIRPARWNEQVGLLPSWHYRLLWIRDGEARIGIGAQAVEVRRDQVLFLAAGLTQQLLVTRPVQAVQLLFDAMHGTREFRQGLTARGLQRLQPPPRTVWGIEPPVVLPTTAAHGAIALIQRIRVRYIRSPHDLLRANAQLGLWLAELVALLSDGAAPAFLRNAREGETRIAHLLSEARSSGEGSVAGLAAQAGISPDHFRRQARQLTGAAPREWLLQARLEQAVELLQRGDEPVAVIAHRCGYASAAAFARAFRNRHALTPSAWRRQARASAMR